jgi:hypothetical protein
MLGLWFSILRALLYYFISMLGIVTPQKRKKFQTLKNNAKLITKT